jgi:hypothetical protein
MKTQTARFYGTTRTYRPGYGPQAYVPALIGSGRESKVAFSRKQTFYAHGGTCRLASRAGFYIPTETKPAYGGPHRSISMRAACDDLFEAQHSSLPLS